MEDKEVADLTVGKEFSARWVKGIDAKGVLQETPAWVQAGVIRGVQVTVRYAEFVADDEAHEALEYSVKNSAAVYQKGLWRGADHSAIGDESWFSRDGGNADLLVRAGRVCASVSCWGGDAGKRTHVAELLGKRIADKASAGAKLIMPKENPPE